jgi:hybrid cluster-associated redox disulfide protein
MLITAETRVDDVLRNLPRAGRVFLDRHTDCIGCYLARFCTLEEVTAHYHLDLQALVASLQACAPAIEHTVEE